MWLWEMTGLSLKRAPNRLGPLRGQNYTGVGATMEQGILPPAIGPK